MTSRMKEEDDGEGRERSLWKTEMWSGQVIGYFLGFLVSYNSERKGKRKGKTKGREKQAGKERRTNL